MNETEWIMSEGGPLICLEKRLEAFWGGIDALTVMTDEVANDYDRACRTGKYLENIPVGKESALIIGDGPLDTAFWQSSAGQVFLVRIWYCDDNFDVDAVMRSLDEGIFGRPKETLEFPFANGDLVMFDSAESGWEATKKSVSFSILPGRYRILTQPYEPDSSTSLVLHRFDLMA